VAVGSTAYEIIAGDGSYVCSSDLRDRGRQHDAFRRSEVIAFGSPIWRVSGIRRRRFATQQRDEMWICEFNSTEATPLLARPATLRDGLSLVVLPFFLIA